MAQYDILLTQNVSAGGTEFTEQIVTSVVQGALITFAAGSDPTVLAPGSDSYVLTSHGAGNSLTWEALAAGHTQNTDTGTTETIFHLDSDSYAIELTAASASKFEVRVSGGATYADMQAKDATFASMLSDDIKASAAAATPDIYSEVTTGTIAIGAGLTTGTLNIAAAGSGASSINIGHTNATTYIVGSIDIPITSAVALGTNGSGVVAAASTTGSGTTLVLSTSPTFATSVVGGASFDVFDTTSTTINAFGAATTMTLGYDGTGASTTNIVTGATTTGLTKTINIGTNGATGSTTAINIGSTIGTTVTVNDDLVVTGDLTVNGTTTTINATTITVDDKNIEIGSVASPSDTTADGGGITLKGSTDKTITWDNANDNWTSNQSWNLDSGLTYKINNTAVLSSTQVLGYTLGSMCAETATNYVTKALYDAYTVLYADSDNTPAALTVSAGSVVGRIAGGIVAIDADTQLMPMLWVTAPATKTSTGTAGTIAEDDNYFYICTATNTWKRCALATNW